MSRHCRFSGKETYHLDQHSFLQYLIQHSLGVLRPLNFQQDINSYYAKCVELSRHKDLQTVHCGAVNDIDIDTTENRYLLSGSSDGSLAIHDLEDLRKDEHNNGMLDTRTYKLICSVSSGNRNAHRCSIETVQWYPLDTGIFTSSGTDRLLKIWDANRLQPAEEYSFSGIVHCHHMSPVASKHSLIAVGTDSSNVRLIDPRAGSATHSLRGHKEGAVRAICWSTRDEFMLATGGIDNFAMLWDVRAAKSCLMKLLQPRSGKKRSSYTKDATHDGSVNGIGFTSNGLQLATIGTDQKLYMWDSWTGKKLPAKYPPISSIRKRSVKFCITANGSENFIFIPTGTSITSFNVNGTSKARHMYGHYNSVNCCVYHESGNQLVSGGNDHKILVWTVRGDEDYHQFACEQRQQVLQNKCRRETIDSVQETVPQALILTQDTWSDDDDGGGDDDDDANEANASKANIS